MKDRKAQDEIQKLTDVAVKNVDEVLATKKKSWWKFNFPYSLLTPEKRCTSLFNVLY